MNFRSIEMRCHVNFAVTCLFFNCAIRDLKNYGSLVHGQQVQFPVQAFPALLLSRDPVHNSAVQWPRSRCDLKHSQQF